MPWSLLVAGLALIWLVVHLARRCSRRRLTRAALPRPPSLSDRRPRWRASRHWQVSAHRFSVRVQSSAFNDPHDLVMAALAKPHNSRMRSSLLRIYDIGSVLGVAGALGALLILFWTTFRLGSAVMQRSHVAQSTARGVLARRGADTPAEPMEGGMYSSNAPLQLIIPGLTVPLSHFPLLLSSLVIAQLVHEAGHALAAALESIPLLSAGASLTLLLPSAFVSLPTAAIAALPPPARLRIVAAGAFHNLLLWGLLLAGSGALTALDAWSAFGYTDVASWARVVTSVAQDSPLFAHLPPGAVITQLDDALLARARPAVDLWSSYLSESPTAAPRADLGWCVERAWFSGQSRACCAATNNTASALACFAAHAPPAERCIDPLLFLDEAMFASARCSDAADCGGAHTCVRQRGDQELLRVTLQLPVWLRGDNEPSERVVLWNGPRAEVLEEVEVSTRLPRSRLLPLRLPLVLSTFFAYLTTLSLSLYFFNLVPLPLLDGAQFLDAALDLWARPTGSHTGVDLAALESGQLSEAVRDRWKGKQRLQTVVQSLTGTLLGLCTMLAIANSLR